MGEFLYLGHAHAYWLSDGQLWLCPRQHWLLRHCQGQGVHQDQFRFGLPNHLWFWFICNCIYFVDFDNFWFSFQQFWTINGILLIFVEKGSRHWKDLWRYFQARRVRCTSSDCCLSGRLMEQRRTMGQPYLTLVVVETS